MSVTYTLGEEEGIKWEILAILPPSVSPGHLDMNQTYTSTPRPCIQQDKTITGSLVNIPRKPKFLVKSPLVGTHGVIAHAQLDHETNKMRL